MVRLRKMRMTAYVACLLIVCMYIAPADPAAAADQVGAVKQKLIAFPFAVSGGVTLPGIGEKIPSALIEYAHGGDAYEIIAFSKRYPSLQRAVLVERTLSEKDLTASFGSEGKDAALKVAREMRGDLVLIGDVESYKYDQATNQSEVMVTAVLMDVQSGRVVKNLAVAGTTPENSKAATEDEAAALAAGNAVTKVAEEVGMVIRTDDTPEFRPEVKKNNKKKRLLWSLILGLGLGIAVSGGGSSGSSEGGGDVPGGDFPPDPPSP